MIRGPGRTVVAMAAAWSLISSAAAAEQARPVPGVPPTAASAEAGTNNEVARVAALQEQFKSGKISGCSLFESESGLVLVLGANTKRGFALLKYRTSKPEEYIFFDDLSQVRKFKRVVRYGSGDAPWTCISN
jgi:hypothetical protein